MENLKIKSITEAFSMQPKTFEAIKELGAYYSSDLTIKNIEKEETVVGFDSGNPIQITCYIGYNHNGERMFQYMANTVNVNYETE
jgi:Tfp pilus assembly protein PilX